MLLGVRPSSIQAAERHEAAALRSGGGGREEALSTSREASRRQGGGHEDPPPTPLPQGAAPTMVPIVPPTVGEAHGVQQQQQQVVKLRLHYQGRFERVSNAGEGRRRSLGRCTDASEGGGILECAGGLPFPWRRRRRWGVLLHLHLRSCSRRRPPAPPSVCAHARGEAWAAPDSSFPPLVPCRAHAHLCLPFLPSSRPPRRTATRRGATPAARCSTRACPAALGTPTCAGS